MSLDGLVKDDSNPSTSSAGANTQDAVDGAKLTGAKGKKKKKNKKEREKAAAAAAAASATAVGTNDIKNAQVSMNKLRDFQKAMEMLVPQGPAKNIDEAKKKHYQFWDTQPVPKLEEKVDGEINEPVEPDKTDVRQDCYSLPGQFQWDTLDVHNPSILQELYTLLNENYVEDDDNMFRFDYSPDFLKWALCPPGWLSQWHVGVRVATNRKLVGFISGIPALISVYGKKQRMAEINFLCVHKKLRAKRVAPVLIREITRRVNVEGIFQAVYTAGVVLPKPLATCRYWHRSLNPKKLVDVKFSHIGRNMTLQRTIKLYKLPENPSLEGLRPLEPDDVPDCYVLLNEYLQKFSLSPVFSEVIVRHWFIPRDRIVNSYVVEADGEVTDFLSFYTLPSSIMHHPLHKELKAAYAFYNVSTKTSMEDLMQAALILAKQAGFDVFNALDLMDNKQFLEKLKFGIGDGNLQYYLYNWRCPPMQPDQISLVLQ
ncbi:glycylpeptide N-tetradecanoyltransferase 2-like [Amphiura filiformis]|uniref:glycylpeptide N-tetradecanoyltransferase 2-like n=1 Tax=Amphiura filiformis TaxID=82378 RepID=UPI003B2170A3